jgi:hypothetical protein
LECLSRAKVAKHNFGLGARLTNGSRFVETRENAAMEETAPQPRFTFRCAGGFSVTVNGQPVPERWRLARPRHWSEACSAPGHWLHRDLLVDSLWSDIEPEAQPTICIRSCTPSGAGWAQNRFTLSDDVVRLCPDARLIVDVDQFEQAAGTAAAAARSLRCNSARSVDRPITPEDQYADWAAEQRERVSETHAR